MAEITIESLQAEISELKRKLAVSQAWMAREVESQVHKIAKRKVTKMTETGKDDFLRENQTTIISERIRKYFGDILLMNAPNHLLEHLIDSEINYFSLSKNPEGDGFSVIGSYNKILDALIEAHISKDFRKYVAKQGSVFLRTNDPLEKALFMVVSKKYILSTGRLYALLRMIRNREELHEFGSHFKSYLEKYGELGKLLLSDEFYRPYAVLIESDVFGGKRHSGRLSFEETKKAREIVTGDFREPNGLVRQFLNYGAVLY